MKRNIFTKRQLLAAAFCLLSPAAPLLAQDAPSKAASPTPTPAENFAALPFIENPQLSPDGTMVAARMAINGKQMLAIVTLGSKEAARIIGLGESDLNHLTWVNDQWLVAGVGAVDNVQGQNWYITRVIGISADAKSIKPIGYSEAGQRADDIVWVARDGSAEILLALQKSIYSNDEHFWPQVNRVDVSKARMRPVVESKPGVYDWYADAAGNVRMGLGYNDHTRTSRLFYRKDNNTSFRTIDKANRRLDESLTVPAMFLADPTKAVTFDSSNGFETLNQLDLQTLTVGKQVFAVPGFDLGGIIPDRAGTSIAGVRYTDDRARVHWFDPEMAKIQANIDKAVGDRKAQIVSMSRDWSRLLVYVGGADRPGAYYFFEPAGGSMYVFAREYDTLGKGALASVKTIHYKARDGLDIAAVLTLPKGRDAKKLPLILLPHGGPHARDSEAWDWWTQFLADRGYAVLQPNYRGSSGYGTAFAEKGEGQWGLAMQDDLNDAVDWAVKEGIADAGRVCIAGASYGGYAAFRAAQRDSAKYRCAISYAGVSDLGAMLRYDGRFLYGGASKDWMRKQAPDLKAVSPINFPDQFSTPLLIMHGKKDLRVPVAQSRDLNSKLKAVGKNVRYIEQPEGDHHFSREQDRLQFLKEMETFLKTYNPADIEAAPI